MENDSYFKLWPWSRTYVNKTENVGKQLKQFEGNYKNPKFRTFNYKVEGANLVMDGSGFHSIIYPESKTTFFVKERDLEFEFIKNDKNQFYKIVVHENGAIVDELLRFWFYHHPLMACPP